jgi:hypothetical protein
MTIKVKQKGPDVVMIRTNNPIEQSWILNFLMSIKRMPEKAHPPISVKNVRGDEMNPPEPPKMTPPPMPMAPIPQGGSQPVSVPQNSGSQPMSQPVNVGETIHLVPDKPVDPSVLKIAEGIAIGKAADAVQKIVEDK